MNETIAMMILAVVQGIAEWLPISSSTHVIIFSEILGLQSSLLLEVALHFGTLMAVVAYFGKDIVDILRDILNFNFKSENGRLGLLLIVASIPAAIFGFLFKDYISGLSGNFGMAALGLAITSLLLFIGSIDSGKKNKEMSFGTALLVGSAQVLSLFRGISRSGSTISTGLFLGLNEKQAVKFSFLLSIPIVFGAGLLTLGNNTLPPNLFIASLFSFFVGISTIHLSFKYILNDRKNLRWIAVYALVLAIGLGIYSLLR